MTRITLTQPWLELDLGAEMQVLSWAINRPGFVTARRILWREVRNADLSMHLDVVDWLGQALAARGAEDAVTFLTSRDVAAYEIAVSRVGETEATAVATVGLSNAERVGTRLPQDRANRGTINIALVLNAGLSPPAMIETVSIVAQARTAAIMDQGLVLPTGVATGTGTDCIAVAAPRGDTGYAGLHTEIGEAVGEAVYAAVLAGATAWMDAMQGGEHATA